MLIIPAIDIKDGCVVRLVQGKLDKFKKVYSADPVKTAKHWAKQGAELMHVVDLDGAYSGVAKNIEKAKEIAASVSIPVEFGGGVRSMETIRELLGAGIARVVLGTKAIQDRGFLAKAAGEFKEKIIVSLDTKAESLAIQGWQDDSGDVKLSEFISILKKAGFKEFIYTDILKDGTLKGPNIQAIKKLLKESGLKIIASGGIASLDDIRRLKLLEKQGVSGVIIGKALYEGKFTLAQALKLA